MSTILASRLDAAEIHRRLAGRWPAVLEQLGIAPEYLRNRHGPCPACGGKDRYRFDDRHQRGGFYCSQCGNGDGFKLLQLVHGWTFAEARAAVVDTASLADATQAHPSKLTPRLASGGGKAEPEIAQPTARVKTLLRTLTTPDQVPDVIDYLRSRKLWPLPADCTWRAHIGVDYYRAAHRDAREHIGRFPALVGVVQDRAGDAVTAHVTYLRDGRKLSDNEPRKLLSSMAGRIGCAVRLFPLAGDVLGVAEGIETAVAASVLHGVPVWAALNTALLAKFEPPPEIRHVVIFADRDVPGLEAAWQLRDRLTCSVELRTPSSPAKDWADVLEVRA